MNDLLFENNLLATPIITLEKTNRSVTGGGEGRLRSRLGQRDTGGGRCTGRESNDWPLLSLKRYWAKGFRPRSVPQMLSRAIAARIADSVGRIYSRVKAKIFHGGRCDRGSIISCNGPYCLWMEWFMICRLPEKKKKIPDRGGGCIDFESDDRPIYIAFSWTTANTILDKSRQNRIKTYVQAESYFYADNKACTPGGRGMQKIAPIYLYE